MSPATVLRVAACLVGLIAVPLTATGRQNPDRASREMAVTFDDLPWAAVVDDRLERARPLTANLLDALRRRNVPAVGFVNEGKLVRGGAIDPDRVALLEAWIASGHELGNHTFSHLDLHTSPVEEMQADVLRGEAITRRLLDARGKLLRFFRHPFLHRGRDADTRIRFEEFLQDRGYRVAPVTIDNGDYLFAAALDRAVARGDEAEERKIVSAYLAYMTLVVEYYEQQSRAFFDREIRQVLLLHANALNARTFDDLARALEARGYAFVSLDRALLDPAYGSPEAYFGPSGISWIHRWAITLGKPGSFFAGEPEVPDWIVRAAGSERLPD
jgi:peptidoglycan/xylan/chitin deacetylase (PgdA/CDA1 family)